MYEGTVPEPGQGYRGRGNMRGLGGRGTSRGRGGGERFQPHLRISLTDRCLSSYLDTFSYSFSRLLSQQQPHLEASDCPPISPLDRKLAAFETSTV